MIHRFIKDLVSFATALLCVAVIGVKPTHGDRLVKTPGLRTAHTLEMARSAAERGLEFLVNDAAKWHQERKCSTCHQGVMTGWAMCEAKSRGYKVSSESLMDTTSWTKERFTGIDKTRDTRPGFNMVNTPAVYLAVMARAIPDQKAISENDVKQIAEHLVRHQEVDGSWAWSLSPAQNRPPRVFESDEVVTLLGCIALSQQVPSDLKMTSAVRDSIEKAAVWLAKTGPVDSTQTAALRLLLKVSTGSPAKSLKPEINRFLSLQNKDGGWGQVKALPSDAYATGQALYVLSLVGVKDNQPAIQRGMAFLIGNQREDGSWPMTSRAQPGATPMTNPSPITYFGSAWATLGLMRSAPKQELERVAAATDP